jgi:hypothetical protein
VWIHPARLIFNFKAAAAFCGVLLTHLAGAEPTMDLVKIASVPMKTAREIVFRGNHAFIGQNLEGMTVLDARNPRKPKTAKRYGPRTIQPLDMQLLSEDRLVVADRFRGLATWNISRPDRITSISEIGVPGIASALELFELDGRSHAAVACGGEGMTFFDIADLETPKRVGRYRINTDYSRDAVVYNRFCYVADNFDGGMKVVRLDMPRPPLYLKISMRGFCDALMLRDDLLIASYRNFGIRFFRIGSQDADDSTTPAVTLLSSVQRSKHRVRKFAVQDNLLAVADDQAGIELYDLSDITLPVLLGEYRNHDEKAPAMSCAFHKGLLYVASWDAGVQVFELRKSARSKNTASRR